MRAPYLFVFQEKVSSAPLSESGRDSHNEIASAVNLMRWLKRTWWSVDINYFVYRTNEIQKWSFVIKTHIIILSQFSNCIQSSSILQIVGDLFFICVINLKSICRRCRREFVARFVTNFQFLILIVLDRDLFIFSAHMYDVSLIISRRRLSTTMDCATHVVGGNGFLEFLVRRAMLFRPFPSRLRISESASNFRSENPI